MNMPLMVDLAGQRIVIVGGGQVAARRASILSTTAKIFISLVLKFIRH